jgi:hypothetical protein
LNRELTSLEQLLDWIDREAVEGSRVSLGAILNTVGRRSFGPLLLVAGLVTFTPFIGAIPGVPTIMAMLVLLTTAQLLLRREYFWLPHWLLKQSMPREKLCKVLKWSRPPARFFDRLSRPRLTIFVQGAGLYIIAIMCIAIAAVMPATEVVPFSAHVAGMILTVFGLALIAHDGLLALLASVITATAFGLVVYQLL